MQIFSIFLNNIVTGEEGEIPIKRTDFEEIIQPFLNKIEEKIKETIEHSKLRNLVPTDIKEILLCGGSIRIQAVKELLRTMLPGIPFDEKENPEKMVAIGATMKAAMDEGVRREVKLIERTPLSIGTSIRDGIFKKIIPRNSRIPTKKYKIEYKTVYKNQTTMDIEVRYFKLKKI